MAVSAGGRRTAATVGLDDRGMAGEPAESGPTRTVAAIAGARPHSSAAPDVSWPAVEPAPVSAAPRVSAAPAMPDCARTRSGPGPSSISTVPSRSVRRTRAPPDASRSTVAAAGWP